MKYTQKDICRILNITRETLRFYEKEGIISPEIDPDNRYRYYDDYQMYRIAECRRYQANEFSVSEIREMMDHDDLDQYIRRMEEKRSLFEKKAEEYFWLKEHTEEYLRVLKTIPEELGKIRESFVESIVFIPEKKGNELQLDQESIEANRYIMNRLQYSFMMAVFPDLAKDDYEWGFGVRTWMRDLFKYNPVKARHLKECRTVSSVIDTGDTWQFRLSAASPLIAYAEEHGLKPSGLFFMRQLVKTEDNGKPHRYFEAYLPVEEDNE